MCLLHQLDNTVGVTPLVVIPADDLEHALAHHHGAASVEDRAVRVANDVRADKCVLGVFKNTFHLLLGSFLHRSVDRLDGYRLLGFDNEVNHRAVLDRDAHRATVKLASELREHLTNGACSTGRGRNDVFGSGAGATQVRVRKV